MGMVNFTHRLLVPFTNSNKSSYWITQVTHGYFRPYLYPDPSSEYGFLHMSVFFLTWGIPIPIPMTGNLRVYTERALKSYILFYYTTAAAQKGQREILRLEKTLPLPCLNPKVEGCYCCKIVKMNHIIAYFLLALKRGGAVVTAGLIASPCLS